jgi:hypothetical protein
LAVHCGTDAAIRDAARQGSPRPGQAAALTEAGRDPTIRSADPG